MVAYLSVINNPSDAVRLRRIINEPKRSIGDATLNTVEEIASQTGATVFSVLENSEVTGRFPGRPGRWPISQADR